MSVLVFCRSGISILETTLDSGNHSPVCCVGGVSLREATAFGPTVFAGLRGSPLSKVLGESSAWFPTFVGGTSPLPGPWSVEKSGHSLMSFLLPKFRNGHYLSLSP